MTEPSLEQWRTLYAAAAEFRERAPWRWFGGDELFAVEDPATGTVGYCSVMGSGGQEFGLAVFVGAEGFNSYRMLVLGETELESFESTALLRSISLNFGDRELTTDRDRAVIRSLGLRFRGRGVWPWFRSQRPGYVPWYLEQEEASLLECGLRQTLVLAERAEAGGLQLTDGLDGEPVLTRCRRGDLWVDEWRPPPEEKRGAEEEAGPPDEVRLRHLRETNVRKAGTWFLDFILLPSAVRDGNERPYYPLLVLVASEEGLIISVQFLQPSAPPAERRDTVVDILEQAPSWPRQLIVASEEIQQLLAPVAAALGISTRIDDLSMLHQLAEMFLDTLG